MPADGETSIALVVAEKKNKFVLWLSKLTQDFCDSFALGLETHQSVGSGRTPGFLLILPLY